MRSWIALLRGVNVGGRNVLPMRELVAMLEGIGCRDVATYVQSGNAVFRHSSGDETGLASMIREAIRSSHGFEPRVLLLTVEQLADAMESNPFPEAEDDPSKLHLFFLFSEPDNADLELIEELRTPTERFELGGGVAYLHAPDGIGRSKLAAQLERAIGVPATGRNWRTACKVLEIATPAEDAAL